MHNSELIDRSSDEIAIMGASLSKWKERYGFPLHLLSAEKVRENIRSFSSVLSECYPRSSIRYAIKAHTHPALLAIISREGAGADVTSHYEAECALRGGVTPDHMDLNGNCKEDSLIDKALTLDMLIVADSFEELELIEARAHALGKRPRVLLRLSGYSIARVTSESVFTAGAWTKFGAPVSEVPSYLASHLPFNHLQFMGFHTHIGSQITSLLPYLEVLGTMIEMGHLQKSLQGSCAMLNIGGGFPVSYLGRPEWEELKRRSAEGCRAELKGDPSGIYCWGGGPGCFEKSEDGTPDESRWLGESYHSSYPKAEMLHALLKGTVNVKGKSLPAAEALKELGEPMLVIEPGRSIVEDAGVTMSVVSHVRKVAGHHNMVTVEMGVTSLCDTMLEGIPNRWEVASNHLLKDQAPFETFIGGNLCFSGDMFTRYKTRLDRRPSRGDILLTHNTGAYTSHFFASHANAFPCAARVLVGRDGTCTVMKHRESFEEIFS